MKRDVTKTGRRTHKGALEDAISYAQRYISNNYRDLHKQRGIDLLIGSDDSHAAPKDQPMHGNLPYSQAVDISLSPTKQRQRRKRNTWKRVRKYFIKQSKAISNLDEYMLQRAQNGCFPTSSTFESPPLSVSDTLEAFNKTLEAQQIFLAGIFCQ